MTSPIYPFLKATSFDRRQLLDSDGLFREPCVSQMGNGVGEALQSVLAGTGSEGEVERILGTRPLGELMRFSVARWVEEFEVPPETAGLLVAAFGLGRLVREESRPVRPCLRSAEDVFEYIAPRLEGLEEERFIVLLLDAQHRLKRAVEATRGTLTSSLVHPREVFREAVREASAAIVVVHNHPSGDPEPSREDLDVSRRLVDAGRLLGIPVVDHVVVGDRSFVSVRERMEF